jgi:hypothetical protein
VCEGVVGQDCLTFLCEQGVGAAMSQTIVLTLPLLTEAEAQVSPEEGPAVEEDEEEGKV